MYLLVGLCACLAIYVQISDGQFVTVNTTSGLLRGQTDLQMVKPVIKFLGVPYASPPIGNLRFTKPAPPVKWSGIREALQHGDKCVQSRTTYNIGPKVNMSEDCLYLNIYSPSVSSSLPVMVWIHGGGYKLGSGDPYDGTYLATKDVVLVTLNYRLNTFGFLSTEDDVMPGNYGMMDQIAALEWVQGNIAGFGGDPKRVTIFGQSAGGGSVSLLLLSPLAKGLYQKAIMESGSSLCPWAIQYPGNKLPMISMTRLLGLRLKCPDIENTTNLLSCLRRVDAMTLLNASETVQAAVADPNTAVMAPRVETTYGFLPDYPLNLIRQGKFNDVHSIRGTNSDELGSFPELALNPFSRDNAMGLMKSLLSQLNELDQQKVIQIATDFFNFNETRSEPLAKQTLDILDNIFFTAASIVEINEITSRSTKTNYRYEFSYRPSYSKFPKWMSAIHFEEVPEVFNVSSKGWEDFFKFKANDVDVAVSNQMMTMWTNFAKTGDPTSSIPPGATQWSPYTHSNPKYIVINSTSVMKTSLSQDIANFYFRFLDILGGSNVGSPSTVVG